VGRLRPCRLVGRERAGFAVSSNSTISFLLHISTHVRRVFRLVAEDESDACITLWIAAWEFDALRAGGSASGNLNVEAVDVELWETLETRVECLAISVEREQLGSEDIGTRLDVAWDLELVAVAIGNDLLVGPFSFGGVVPSALNLEEIDVPGVLALLPLSEILVQS
jgi:hypothetical protein